MTRLQNPLLHKAGICFEKDMYFRPVMAQERLLAVLDEQRQCCRLFEHDALYLLCFLLTTLVDGGAFYGGSYGTKAPKEPARDVKITVNICVRMDDDVLLEPASKARRLLRRITFNGYLLPAKGNRILPMYAPSAYTAYRAKRILNYNPISEKGYMTQKSYKGLLRAVRQYLQVLRLVDKGFEAAREDHRINFPKVTNEKFWRKYLLAEES